MDLQTVIIGTKTLADAFKSMTELILRDLVRLSLPSELCLDRWPVLLGNAT